MDTNRLAYLVQQYETNRITPVELDEFYFLLRSFEHNAELLDSLEDAYQKTTPLEIYPDQWKPVLDNILQHKQKSVVRSLPNRFSMRWMTVAAAIILILSTTVIFLTRNNGKQVEVARNSSPVQSDIAPGGDKAILTLADGTNIILDTAANGALTKQGGVKVIKIGGQLAYNAETKTSEVLYNSITTPKGGQYQLELADGSKVWLNAASSLRFPTAFVGKDRTVELTGEGYFEVAHNAEQPFHVKVSDMDVQVLGTHFNINSYGDEPSVRTTLLEGRVAVTLRQAQGDKQVYLNPGQQAIIKQGGSDINVDYDVDVEEVVAWKNGRFYFNSADIQTIMRQIQRWYDVEVSYPNGIPEGRYRGKPSRNVNASQVLNILEEAGLNFKIEGKKITVMQWTIQGLIKRSLLRVV